MMNLLEIIQEDCRLLSLPVPASIVDSTDVQVLQLWAIANEEGRNLQRSYDWQLLTQEYTYTTSASEDQPTAIPDDLDRWIANSMFDRTTRREVIGPITPQMWQAIKAQPQLNRVFLAWRERTGIFYTSPTPTAGDTVAYEYVSANWVMAENGDLKSTFTADTDVPLLADQMFVLGIRWRFLKSKGIDYAQDFDTYVRERQVQHAIDGGNGKLNITGRTLLNIWGYPNVPLGNFPSG